MTYRFPIRIGDRVAIAPHHDLWMAGCRFGTVTGIGGAGSMGGRFYFVDILHASAPPNMGGTRNVTLAEADLLGAVGTPDVWDRAATSSTEVMVHSSGADEHERTPECEADACYPVVTGDGESGYTIEEWIIQLEAAIDLGNLTTLSALVADMRDALVTTRVRPLIEPMRNEPGRARHQGQPPFQTY